jgi:hypothetical protein
MLRAERKGNGNGRVYTLSYRVEEGDDDEVNETKAEAKVYGPPDASDLKDLIGDDDGDRDDMGPICPRPTEAIDELAEIFPGLGSVRTKKSCDRICKAWTKSCNQIGSGSAKCVQGETRALALVGAAECKDSDDRAEVRECRDSVKTRYKRLKAALREDAAEAKDTCARYGQRCLNACDAMFDDVTIPVED